MTQRLLAVLAMAAFAASCQTQPEMSDATLALPTPTLATVAPGRVSPRAPTAASTFQAAKYLQMRPDTVHVWSDSARFPALDVTVKDAARATALLHMAARLQPAGLRYCPIDFGLGYAIEWWQEGQMVAEAGVQAQGCQELQLDDGPTVATTPDFWNALADLVGVPEPKLHPTSIP
jgi:hypothetical protein